MAKKNDAQTQLLDALLEEVLSQGKSAEDLLGQNGLSKQMTGRLLERMLAGELTDLELAQFSGRLISFWREKSSKWEQKNSVPTLVTSKT
jgi:hypothetical protein